MKIIVDTNILVAALLLGSNYLARLIQKIIDNYNLVICSYVINELYNVIRRKNFGEEQVLKEVFEEMEFIYVNSPNKVDEDKRLFKIRDEKDYIILHTAIIENVDIFITNDRDFFDIDIEYPKIMTPKEFNEKY